MFYKILIINFLLVKYSCTSLLATPQYVPSKTLLSDSISPQGYYIETARASQFIQKTFPFDIDLRDTAGRIANSYKLLPTKGKPLVVLFWLTTCPPCRLELEAIQREYEIWQREIPFRLVAISTDFSDNYPKFRERVREGNWQFEAYHDLNREFMYVMQGGLNGLPQLFIFNEFGEVIYHKRRYNIGDEKELFEKLKSLQPAKKAPK
jgi:thiol-disulfide isomerase/thioredoxin